MKRENTEDCESCQWMWSGDF